MRQIPKVIFLDYQVIDHLYRLDTGTYQGTNTVALHRLHAEANSGKYQVWMAKITQVEMIIGRENTRLDPARIPHINRKDSEKLAIAARMGVRWLEYPCSGFDDQYSRWDVSFGFRDEPGWSVAKALEQRLEQMPGISVGDARQVVSLVYGFDSEAPSTRPIIQWLVSEDRNLRQALIREVEIGRLHELTDVRIASVLELVAANR